MIAYSDSDNTGDIDDRKSTYGYIVMMGSGTISWSSRKHPVVTLSTTEDEFISTAHCSWQAIWLRRVLEIIGQEQKHGITLFCDNSSTKDIDVRFHFLRNLSKDGAVELIHCPTQQQLADIMKKAVKQETFSYFKMKMGMMLHSEVLNR